MPSAERFWSAPNGWVALPVCQLKNTISCFFGKLIKLLLKLAEGAGFGLKNNMFTMALTHFSYISSNVWNFLSAVRLCFTDTFTDSGKGLKTPKPWSFCLVKLSIVNFEDHGILIAVINFPSLT
jgi:hypothetical protein